MAGWRRERLPKLPDAAYVELAPDWVGEVLSPSTARLDRFEKRHIYARENVQFLWLVDPRARTLEVFDAGVFADDARISAVPFDAIELVLGSLWADAELRPEE